MLIDLPLFQSKMQTGKTPDNGWAFLVCGGSAERQHECHGISLLVFFRGHKFMLWYPKFIFYNLWVISAVDISVNMTENHVLYTAIMAKTTFQIVVKWYGRLYWVGNWIESPSVWTLLDHNCCCLTAAGTWEGPLPSPSFAPPRLRRPLVARRRRRWGGGWCRPARAPCGSSPGRERPSHAHTSCKPANI